MNIMLTGGTGMVGRNILENDKLKKHNISAPMHKELDLMNYEEVYNYLKKNEFELIIHSAGKVGGIQANMKDKDLFLIINYEIGKNIVTAAKECGIKKIINLASSCIYPRDRETPLKEEDILKGELEPTNEGYALAKISVLRLCQYITEKNSGFQYKSIIPCNLYGRWDKFEEHHSHLIPAIIKKVYDAINNKINYIEIWGDGTARREFMYASDLADLISYAVDNFDKMPLLMNVGIGRDYTINEYYEEVIKVFNAKLELKHDLSKPVGMKRKLVDITRLKEFGWSSKTSLSDGIKKTVEYYLNIKLEKNYAK